MSSFNQAGEEYTNTPNLKNNIQGQVSGIVRTTTQPAKTQAQQTSFKNKFKVIN